MEITSAQNPRIKHLLTLQQKSSERRRKGLFVVEGRRELEHCLAAGFQLESLFYVPLSSTQQRDEIDLATVPCGDVLSKYIGTIQSLRDRFFSLTPSLYEKVAYRGSTEGVIAVMKERHITLADLSSILLPPSSLHHQPSPLIMVLESVEKPGNLGAVLRSADAGGADAVIVCDPLTDLYNPNVIRSSIGAVFTVPTVACTSEECIRFLQEHHIRILTAQLQDSQLYYDIDMRQPTAIVMGTESTGLTQAWRDAADAHIRIPMLGDLDSLNVSVSAAILLFEAVRQRTLID